MTIKQRRVFIRILAAIAFTAAALLLSALFEINEYLEAVLFLIPYFIIGYDILKKAFHGIQNRQVFDENFLMAVATIGAILLGDFKESVAVMLFYQIGELFQSAAIGKSRKSIAALMDIRPDYANVILPDGKIEKTDPEQVAIGTLIGVNPGEKVPIDGVVIEGETALNTSALTGESIPQDVKPGDMVVSGCINLTIPLKLETTKVFGDSTVSKILELMEHSSMKKSRSENFITKFAKYYTPAVCYGALALALVPPIIRLILGDAPHWYDWIKQALTFLVISCPCALVISIPLSFFAGIGCASKHGILVKGSNYLEALANAKYFVFDKTGTLTKGVFEVTGIFPENGFTEKSLLFYAASAESASNHPISLSLKRAYGAELDPECVNGIKEIAGQGVTAWVDGQQVYVGNQKLMEYAGVDVPQTHSSGESLVFVCVSGTYAGVIGISDVIKPSSKEAVTALKKMGVLKTVILTGDTQEVAVRVAHEIGIDTVRSGLLPLDKVNEVEALLAAKGKREKLAYVGDGINDAPVLSRADIGIAMGGLGSDAAIEAADIVLMDDDPCKIALAMRISSNTLKIVRQNIIFALAVKFACLFLGAFGIATMWEAIFADVGVMVIAVLNAMRAMRIKR